jgi:signal transduction histidine kinase
VDGGAGLGLAICSWAVQAHGGTIRVESELGRGATFLVTLPAHIPADRMTVPSRFARVRQEATAG